jgi:hypothetical protein
MSTAAGMRSDLPLAPPDYDVSRLPDPLVDDGEPVTLETGGEIYGKCIGSRYNNGEPSKVDDHLSTYGRYHGADRLFQYIYALTTVMLTFRLSPTNVMGRQVIPLTLDSWIHTPRESVMNALHHVLDKFTWDWIAVTAATKRWATPHIHLYLWIDDPGNEISTEMFEPAIEKHVDQCPTAYSNQHRYQEAISVEYEPETETIPWSSSDEHGGPVTTGCKYVSQQLPHLPLSRDGEVSDTELQSGALAWASPYQWCRSSRGVFEKS